ncbi:MAG: hypothetical protein MRY83_07990 [Flavobacteriales bacterium]|nr:hypothetical protein [Flavobacteriales bacterium]
MRNFIFIFAVIFWCSDLNAQQSIRDSSIAANILDFTYGHYLPSGDMSDRFYDNSALGISFTRKFESNFFLTLNYSFLFRDKVKEDSIFNPISTESGFLIDGNGQFAEYFLYQRGFKWDISFGKLFPFGPNPNSGFFASAGIGLLQHKIKIQHIANTAPQIIGEYQKGYDRLSNGLMLSQFLGYRLLSNNRLINIVTGFEFNQAFTKNRRDFNFDEMKKDDKQRVDLLSGFRFGISLPLYKKVPKDFYFY